MLAGCESSSSKSSAPEFTSQRRRCVTFEGVTARKSIDLALEGGGVKGIALVGAIVALDEAGYRFERIAGSSAGALVGAIVAAMQQAGESLDRAEDIVRSIDYLGLLDRRRFAHLISWWPKAAAAWGVLFHMGVYQGQALQDWLGGVLGEFDVHTFGDLWFDDPGSSIEPERSFRLVVTTSDLSRRRRVYLPWDLRQYNKKLAAYPVARAVRASTAIPYFFEPMRLRGPLGESTLVDGSVLDTYPVDAFDRTDGRPSRWPTIGVRLSAPAKELAKAQSVDGPLELLSSLVYTTLDSTQVRYLQDHLDAQRSIFVRTRGVGPMDFELAIEQSANLFDAGYSSVQKWLKNHPQGSPLATPGPLV
jgi:NTE family protein